MEGQSSFLNEGDLVLLSAVNPPRHIVTNASSNKLLLNFIGPFRVLRSLNNAYTIELPRKMRTHTTLYVGRLWLYYQYGFILVMKALALKHLQQKLVLTMLALSPRLKFGYLPAKPRYILWRFQ